MNDEFWRFEGVAVDVAPGFVADGSVGLPIKRAHVAELPAFDVENASALLHRVVFVVDDSDMVAVFQRAVVIERSEACEIRRDRSLSNPPVEVDAIRAVFLNQFTAARKPIVSPGR